MVFFSCFKYDLQNTIVYWLGKFPQFYLQEPWICCISVLFSTDYSYGSFQQNKNWLNVIECDTQYLSQKHDLCCKVSSNGTNRRRKWKTGRGTCTASRTDVRLPSIWQTHSSSPSQGLTCLTFDLPQLHFCAPDGTQQLLSLASWPLLTCNRSTGPPGWNWWPSRASLRSRLSNQSSTTAQSGDEDGSVITSVCGVFVIENSGSQPSSRLTLLDEASWSVVAHYP